MAAPPQSVTLHSTWRSLIGGAFTGSSLTVAGLYGVNRAGFHPVPTVILVVGVIVALAMLFDYPIATSFTRDGLTRRMVLRRQHFAWGDIDQLTRTRPTMMRFDRELAHGGLVAKVGRRRYLLVDQCESADEFDTIIDVVEQDGGPGEGKGVSMLPRPGEKATPTWLYRRRKWRPEWASDR